jgi:hypothetical protein
VAAPVPLADFDPPVARAVIRVLRRAGVPADVHEPATAGAGEDGVTVLVPGERRDEAMAALAAGMDAIQEELRRQAPPEHGPGGGTAASASAPEDAEEEPPLVFERLRRLGFLPVLLVPLLVVTLSQIRLSAVYAFVLLVGGAAAVVAWRDRRRHRG